jgi:ABC-type spermidine/putrescine transport system permease subunit II
MFEKPLRIYSALFRYAGLAIAIMSLIVSVVIGVEIAQQGYIVVNGDRSHALGSIATAVGTPLIGVVIGLALYFLVPKVRRRSDGGGPGGQ